ncbi:MAG: hypothetical protein K8F91_17190, partial [Candidatus Obscuribacterales bacterium]|nr:hypothetical protein [Candidatus Obscuribacterales bacterium]
MDILQAEGAFEFVGSNNMLAKVLARLHSSEPRPIFTIRPQMGRLKLYSHSSQYQDQDKWKQLIVKESLKESTSFEQSSIVSYSTPAYSRLVEHLGAGQEENKLVAIKKSLKNRFDPDHRLNPLVRFF